MKKIVCFALLFCVLLPLAALADSGFQLQPEKKDALREAGREYDDLLTAEGCEDVAVILARSGDTAQLTVLEKNGDGAWRVAVVNDTIPLSFITDASISSWLTFQDDGVEIQRFELEMEAYISLPSGERELQSYRDLCFMRTPEGNWTLNSALDVPGEEAAEGYCPYHWLWLTKDGWLYRFYEEILDDNGKMIDRSEEILRKTVSMEEMAPYTELSEFDYPAFLSFLHALAPTEYEHAPIYIMPLPPLPTVPPVPFQESNENAQANSVPDFVYFNPLGGKRYHADPNCPSVSPEYWPLSPIPFKEINRKEYRNLLQCAACNAPDRQAALGNPLYAVQDDNGLWGYIDSQGNVVIPCTYTWAEDFRGGYALARLIPEGEPETEYGYYGIIDASGQWVLKPEYYDVLSQSDSGDWANGRDAGIYYIVDGWEKDSKAGFFDIPSGFFSGLIYDSVDIDWTGKADREYICVVMDGKLGFASRKTGEIVIPCQYSPDDSRGFRGDYCKVMPYETKVADGWILIDRQGKEVPLPENCYAVSTFHDDLAVIWDSSKDLYGYIDPTGNVVIEPQYLYAYEFSEGLACVQLQTGEWAMIAPDGSTAFVRWDTANAHHSSMYCSHGLIRCGTPDNGPVVFLNKAGEEVFRLEIEGLVGFSDFKENGVAFYEVHSDQLVDSDGLGVGLFNDQGEILTPPIFWVEDADWDAEFSEGLFPIWEIATGKMCYIDERGQWAFPPVDGYCWPFRDGLAQIAMNPDVVFVDREGREIYRFTVQ